MTGCHFLLAGATWERMASVAKSELSASMQKDFVESREMSTGAIVTFCLSLSKAVFLSVPQFHLQSFQVRSKSGQVCLEKSLINRW